MAQLNQPFDANHVNPNPVFETLPEGEYLVMVADSEMKPTNAKDGEYLNLTLEVLDGPYKGRIIFDRLNLVNKNPKAVEIAQRQLSQICHAVGVLRVADSTELHNRPMVAKVGIEVGNPKRDATGSVIGKYEDKNKIKSYRPASGGAPVAAASATAPAPTTAPAAARPAPGGMPPWAKKAS